MTILTITDYLLAFWQTLYTVLVASSLAISVGLCLGCFLSSIEKSKKIFIKWIACILEMIVNLGRSTPFIILLIALIPITRWIVGTSIGVNAALVPLTFAAIPFYARITQSALKEIPLSISQYSQSLGISSFQAFRFIYIPEIRIPLISGATLTIINLISYSAIAGVVGGGGIGQLAIDYGYQRFDVHVILITVFILFLLVQAIQWLGNYVSLKLTVKTPVILFFLSAALSVIVYNFPWQPPVQNVIRLGVMSGASAEIFNQLQPIAEKKFHIHYKVITFDDYSQPNRALNDGDLDINIFQHKPFLDQDIQSHHYQISTIIPTFTYPIGFYSIKLQSIHDLRPGSLVALSNDASNQGRELRLLADHHIIGLKSEDELLATIHDINFNPYQLKFITMDGAALPRALQDADLVAVNNDFLKDVHLQANQALLIEEGKQNPYVNIAVIQTSDLQNPEWKKWSAFLHSKESIDTMNAYYPNGEAVPGW
jgi:D-methionine transport system permease protein